MGCCRWCAVCGYHRVDSAAASKEAESNDQQTNQESLDLRYRSNYQRPTGKNRRPRLIILVVLLLAALLALAAWRVGPAPELDIELDVPGIGPSTTVVGTALESQRGLSDVRLELIQGERSWLLVEQEFEPRPFWAFWGDATEATRLETLVNGSEMNGLEEGEVVVRLSAERASTWFRRPGPHVVEERVPARFRPPSLDLGPTPVRVRQGGSGVVRYRVGDTAVESGVLAGDAFFRGFPVPDGGPQDRFVIFAVPYDQASDANLRLQVRDALGNELKARFVTRFTPKPLKSSQIRLNDRFLDKVVGEITSRTAGLSAAGSPLETYLRINGDLRRANASELVALAERSASEMYWSRPFQQQPNSQLMDDFAARRSYVYDGRQVDTQDHLGFDLASVRRAPVAASNRGRVVLAGYFGIYGNTVVLDHGYGLHTLYAHLSAIEVEEGVMVERGQSLGRSGETGLAGGDHLHFSILVGGHPVDPLEWFDGRWIETRLIEAVPSLPFEG